MLNSLHENDDIEEQGLNKTANSLNNFQEAIFIIRHYEDIIKTQNKKPIEYIGKQGQLFKKFKETETFLIMLITADQQYILTFQFISF